MTEPSYPTVATLDWLSLGPEVLGPMLRDIIKRRQEEKRRSRREERFAARIAPPDENGCEVWTGALDKGYGKVGAGASGRTERVHRRAWERAHGPIPEGRELHHECGNKACVNVEHLRVVTPEEHRKLHPR
jgi:HNH endonuclease